MHRAPYIVGVLALLTGVMASPVVTTLMPARDIPAARFDFASDPAVFVVLPHWGVFPPFIPATGACCTVDGSDVTCRTTRELDCIFSGGIYAGDDVPCEDGCPDRAACLNGTGSCFQSHKTPGCADATCCETVCFIDPFCCDIAWDPACAHAALAECALPGASSW